VEIFRDSRAV